MNRDWGPEEWLAREAVVDLIYRYSDSVTRGDYEQTATVFAPDAVWELPEWGLRFETARAFLDYLIDGSASVELLIQTPHSPVVELLGPTRARATTTIHEIVRSAATADGSDSPDAGETNLDWYGIYHDEAARFGAEWKFTRRVFVPFFTATDGAVVGPRPLLRRD
jgi:hypothetical protein